MKSKQLKKRTKMNTRINQRRNSAIGDLLQAELTHRRASFTLDQRNVDSLFQQEKRVEVCPNILEEKIDQGHRKSSFMRNNSISMNRRPSNFRQTVIAVNDEHQFSSIQPTSNTNSQTDDRSNGTATPTLCTPKNSVFGNDSPRLDSSQNTSAPIRESQFGNRLSVAPA